ncbi:MAG TPA: sensor histidine kinase [Anaerolineales bacterium]|nr:sensor histidine kinase [Anaerolineales bacterium]
MHSPYFSLIYFFYGLAFFSMGLAITLELGHGSDERLRHAFRPMAVFGFLHGANEWVEMFAALQLLPGQIQAPLLWEAIHLALLTFSFLSLAAFGVFLLARSERTQRYSLLIPLLLVAVWGLGLLVMRGKYPLEPDLLYVANAWTRYVIGVPAALLAAAGLIVQQREFRLKGMASFGRDSLWAAIAFVWYGLIGQMFPHEGPLPPSNLINQEMFLEVFGFPIQLLRAAAAIAASVFIMRVLRAFEEETRRHIAGLQAERLAESERLAGLRGEMLRRIVSAQEAERIRIARELHDETGQALTAIGLGLRGVSSNLASDKDKASRNLRNLEGLVDHSLIELQRLIADLRPSHLDDLGLVAAVRWYANEIQNRIQLEVRVEVGGVERLLPGEVKTALFRVAQEALANIVKHANANSAAVFLDFQPRGVYLSVADDGAGFDPAQRNASRRSAWGLMGMEERTQLLGGTFRLITNPGKGTEIQVFIPYQGQEESNEDSSLVG